MQLKKSATIFINDDDKKYFEIFNYQIVLRITYGDGQTNTYVYAENDYEKAIELYRKNVIDKAEFYTFVNKGYAQMFLCAKDRMVMQININC